MMFLFLLSLAAVWIGVAAIVGAFLAGMALAESVSQRERHLVHGVAELLVPFFLVGIGMKVDLAIFREWPVLRLAILLLIAAAVTKFVGCGLGAIRLGGTEALRVGVGMIPRGEVGHGGGATRPGDGRDFADDLLGSGLHECRDHHDRSTADQAGVCRRGQRRAARSCRGGIAPYQFPRGRP